MIGPFFSSGWPNGLDFRTVALYMELAVVEYRDGVIECQGDCGRFLEEFGGLEVSLRVMFRGACLLLEGF